MGERGKNTSVLCSALLFVNGQIISKFQSVYHYHKGKDPPQLLQYVLHNLYHHYLVYDPQFITKCWRHSCWHRRIMHSLNYTRNT